MLIPIKTSIQCKTSIPTVLLDSQNLLKNSYIYFLASADESNTQLQITVTQGNKQRQLTYYIGPTPTPFQFTVGDRIQIVAIATAETYVYLNGIAFVPEENIVQILTNIYLRNKVIDRTIPITHPLYSKIQYGPTIKVYLEDDDDFDYDDIILNILFSHDVVNGHPVMTLDIINGNHAHEDELWLGPPDSGTLLATLPLNGVPKLEAVKIIDVESMSVIA